MSYNKDTEDDILRQLEQSLELDKHQLQEAQEEDEDSTNFNRRYGLGYVPKTERILTQDELKLKDYIKGKKKSGTISNTTNVKRGVNGTDKINSNTASEVRKGFAGRQAGLHKTNKGTEEEETDEEDISKLEMIFRDIKDMKRRREDALNARKRTQPKMKK